MYNRLGTGRIEVLYGDGGGVEHECTIARRIDGSKRGITALQNEYTKSPFLFAKHRLPRPRCSGLVIQKDIR